MAREYTTEELQRLLAGSERFFLIDVLPEDSYLHRHLPGAISLPVEFVLPEHVAHVLTDPEALVIAYCASPS